jgi:vitamin K-dependent gamma-carboxylase
MSAEPLGARLRRWWSTWEDFCDERESPVAIALVRILLGICLVYDFAHIWFLDLVVPLFSVAAVGGVSDALIRESTPLWYRVFPGTLWAAQLHHAALLLSSLGLLTGTFQRVSVGVLLFASVQFVEVVPYSDRGIDTLLRLVLCILWFSPASRTLSVDAWVRTGSLLGDGRPEPAWAKRLIIGQIVLMYFGAGTQKVGITWWPMGHMGALYFALQDPAVAAWDFSFIRQQPYFFLAQVGATVTMLKQYTYPTVLLLFWWKRNPGRGGRIAELALRWHLEWLWITVGFVFHVILGFTMNLGIFPWAMLALYPVWVGADTWHALLGRLGIRMPVA